MKSLSDILTTRSLHTFLPKLYKEERVIVALLALAKPPAERRSGSRHWSVVQQEELQLHALATLATIAPLMLEDYMSCLGSTCMLLLLDWCVRQGEESKRGVRHNLTPQLLEGLPVL